MRTNAIGAIIGIVISALIVFGSTMQAYAATAEPRPDNNRQSLFSYIIPKSEISVEQAVKIAYNHAGVNKQDVIFPGVTINEEDEVKTYQVSFYVGMTEYYYEIDAASGKILNNSVFDYNEAIN